MVFEELLKWESTVEDIVSKIQAIPAAIAKQQLCAETKEARYISIIKTLKARFQKEVRKALKRALMAERKQELNSKEMLELRKQAANLVKLATCQKRSLLEQRAIRKELLRRLSDFNEVWELTDQKREAAATVLILEREKNCELEADNMELRSQAHVLKIALSDAETRLSRTVAQLEEKTEDSKTLEEEIERLERTNQELSNELLEKSKEIQMEKKRQKETHELLIKEKTLADALYTKRNLHLNYKRRKCDATTSLKPKKSQAKKEEE